MNSSELAAWKAKRDAALQLAQEKRAQRSHGGGGGGGGYDNNQNYNNNSSAAAQAAGLSDFMPAKSRCV
jgi:hypothetical protein